MKVREECVETRNSSVIVAEENGRRMVFNNPGRKSVSKISVDRCVFKGDSTHKRCDYVVEISEPLESVYYLELKGSKIDHGIEQLAATLGHFQERHRHAERKCVLVASSVPGLGAGTQSRKDKFYRHHKVEIEIKRSQHQVTI